jgi:hypothetical protein
VVLSSALGQPPLAGRVRATSPWSRETIYLIPSNTKSQTANPDAQPVTVRARGGIPSGERALGDPETADVAAWVNTPADRAWAVPDPADVLRAIDRFHPVPDVPTRADSWAEWLYFNGRSPTARFYLTFLIGPYRAPGRRIAGIRLQVDRGRGVESFGGTEQIGDSVAAGAPELAIGGGRVRLEGMRYRITLDLRDARGRTARGDLFIEAAPGRLLPPFEIHGAAGWRTGYVVPVMSGGLGGSLEVDGERLDLSGGVGYHDHNWGFWQGVSWQWGQVQTRDMSFVYGRVFPPSDAADRARMPGFLAAIGPGGPIGYATNVTINEVGGDGPERPRQITVRATSASINLSMTFDVEDAETTRLDRGPLSTGLDFLQLRGKYTVTGHIGERAIQLTAPGSAETFRGR